MPNDIDNIQTFSSCQGSTGQRKQDAYVSLRCLPIGRRHWGKIFAFAEKLVLVLSRVPHSIVTTKRHGDKETACIALSIRPDEVDTITNVLADHKTVFSYSRQRTKPGN